MSELGFEAPGLWLREVRRIQPFQGQPQRDVLQDLPEAVVGSDFEPLKISSMQQIRDAINQATGGAFAQGIFQFEPR